MDYSKEICRIIPLELILPKDWQKHINNYKEYNRFDQDCLNDLCKMLEVTNDAPNYQENEGDLENCFRL